MSRKGEKKYSRKTLIQQIRAEAKRQGHPPTSREITEASKERRTASLYVFVGRFGSWNKAKQVAGLVKNCSNYPNYSNKELIEWFTKKSRKFLGPPGEKNIREDHKKGLTASVETFRKRFGSLMKLRRKVLPQIILELLRKLGDEVEKRGRLLTVLDIQEASRERKMVSCETIIKYLGSINKAKRKAGVKVKVRKKRKPPNPIL